MAKNNRSKKKSQSRTSNKLQIIPSSPPLAMHMSLATLEQRTELWHLQVLMKRDLEIIHPIGNMLLTVGLQLPFLHVFYKYIIESSAPLIPTMFSKFFIDLLSLPSSALDADILLERATQLFARANIFTILSLANYQIQRYMKARYVNYYADVDPCAAKLTITQANNAIETAKINKKNIHDLGFILKQSMVMFILFCSLLISGMNISETDSLEFTFFAIWMLSVMRHVMSIPTLAIPFSILNRMFDNNLTNTSNVFISNIKYIFSDIDVDLKKITRYNPNQQYNFIDNIFTFAENFFAVISPQRLIKIDYQHKATKQSIPMTLSVKLLAYILADQAGIHVVMANTNSMCLRMDGDALHITEDMQRLFKTAHDALNNQYQNYKTISTHLNSVYQALPDNHKLIISCQLKRSGLYLIMMTKSEALLAKLNSVLLGSSDVASFMPDDTSITNGLKIKLTPDICMRLAALEQGQVIPLPTPTISASPTEQSVKPVNLIAVSHLTHSTSSSLFAATSSDRESIEARTNKLSQRRVKTKLLERAPKPPRWWFDEQFAMPKFPRHQSFNEADDMPYKHIPRSQYNHLYGFISMPSAHLLYHKFNKILDSASSRRSGKGSGSSIGVIDRNKINLYLSASEQEKILNEYWASFPGPSTGKLSTLPTIYELHTNDNIRMIGYPVDSCAIVDGSSVTQAKLINFCILVENAHSSHPITTFFDDPYLSSTAKGESSQSNLTLKFR